MRKLQYQTKTQALTTELAALARKLGPDARLPTMRALSEQLGVSGMTINRALSELEAQGIIYRRQGAGTYVSAQAARTVGLVYDRDVFGTQTSPFAAMLVDEARRRADAGNEKFRLFLAEPQLSAEVSPPGSAGKSDATILLPDDLVEAVRARQLQGVLFAGESNPAALAWLQDQLPLVALAVTPVAKWRVQIDHSALVKSGVEALAARGCRRIGLWIPLGVGLGRKGRARSFPERDAFLQALKKCGLQPDAAAIWHDEELRDDVLNPVSESNQSQGLRAAREVFGDVQSRGKKAPVALPFDGLVIDDDLMTRGALTALSQLGLQPGRDIHIATHANRGAQTLLGYEEQLIRLEINPAEIAVALFGQLETLMDGKTPPA
ncbi:MAG TPA: GntR family transcriptional regulator, partial [Abditibacteriaceae bacterium]